MSEAYTFRPGGYVTKDFNLQSPYIFVIVLSSVILLLIIIIIIREMLKSRGMFQDCCSWKGSCCECITCQECCVSCAETCDCCNTTSIESCLDACCPKRGSIEFADIITCEACCSGQCCECCGTACICAPTDVSNVNCLCCACQQQYPQWEHEDR